MQNTSTYRHCVLRDMPAPRSCLSQRLAPSLRREGRTSDLLRREDFVEEDEEAEQVGEVAADAEDVLRSSAPRIGSEPTAPCIQSLAGPPIPGQLCEQARRARAGGRGGLAGRGAAGRAC